MFKSFIPCLLTFAILTSCAFVDSPMRRITNNSLPSIVKVQGIMKDRPATCTGFVVNSAFRQVITAKHCVDNVTLGTLIVDGMPARIIKTNDGYALLVVDGLDKPRLEIAKKRVEAGDELYAFGYGYNNMTVLFRRVIWIVNGLKPNSAFIVDGMLYQGMSGGPVINTEGKVAGMIQMSNREDVVGLASGAEEMREFLK